MIGLVLGTLLGRLGTVEMIRFFMTIPLLVIKSPGKIKKQWTIWHELRTLKKMDTQRRKDQMNELKKRVEQHKKDIRELKMQMRRIKWGNG
ncbi:MAG: hypothetical protein H8E61_09705 [Bacteroidetes bacterium]|nr:hypothetical protein [Bacteroidota bacterium]